MDLGQITSFQNAVTKVIDRLGLPDFIIQSGNLEEYAEAQLTLHELATLRQNVTPQSIRNFFVNRNLRITKTHLDYLQNNYLVNTLLVELAKTTSPMLGLNYLKLLMPHLDDIADDLNAQSPTGSSWQDEPLGYFILSDAETSLIPINSICPSDDINWTAGYYTAQGLFQQLTPAEFVRAQAHSQQATDLIYFYEFQKYKTTDLRSLRECFDNFRQDLLHHSVGIARTATEEAAADEIHAIVERFFGFLDSLPADFRAKVDALQVGGLDYYGRPRTFTNIQQGLKNQDCVYILSNMMWQLLTHPANEKILGPSGFHQALAAFEQRYSAQGINQAKLALDYFPANTASLQQLLQAQKTVFLTSLTSKDYLKTIQANFPLALSIQQELLLSDVKRCELSFIAISYWVKLLSLIAVIKQQLKLIYRFIYHKDFAVFFLRVLSCLSIMTNILLAVFFPFAAIEESLFTITGLLGLFVWSIDSMFIAALNPLTLLFVLTYKFNLTFKLTIDILVNFFDSYFTQFCNVLYRLTNNLFLTFGLNLTPFGMKLFTWLPIVGVGLYLLNKWLMSYASDDYLMLQQLNMLKITLYNMFQTGLAFYLCMWWCYPAVVDVVVIFTSLLMANYSFFILAPVILSPLLLLCAVAYWPDLWNQHGRAFAEQFNLLAIPLIILIQFEQGRQLLITLGAMILGPNNIAHAMQFDLAPFINDYLFSIGLVVPSLAVLALGLAAKKTLDYVAPDLLPGVRHRVGHAWNAVTRTTVAQQQDTGLDDDLELGAIPLTP